MSVRTDIYLGQVWNITVVSEIRGAPPRRISTALPLYPEFLIWGQCGRQLPGKGRMAEHFLGLALLHLGYTCVTLDAMMLEL
jgi:hypothetical protein